MKADPHDRIISTRAVGGAAGRRNALLLTITLIALMVGGGTLVYLYRDVYKRQVQPRMAMTVKEMGRPWQHGPIGRYTSSARTIVPRAREL